MTDQAHPSELSAVTGDAASPLVSVVVPTYQRGNKIAAVLQSVLAQTYPNFEVVVVDDASTDDTESTVASMGDERIRFLRHDVNKGGNAARMTGVGVATGEYVAFLDSDDYWAPTKLERQVRLLQEKGPEYTFCTTWFESETPTGEKLQLVAPVLDGKQINDLSIANVLGGCSVVLINRQALLEVGGLDTTLPSCQDWDLFVRLNETGGVCVVPENLVRYVQDDADPVRITGKRESVTAGHRHMYEMMRARMGRFTPEEKVRGHQQFIEFFAADGSLPDLVRVLADSPLRLWTQPKAYLHAIHMGARLARRQLSGFSRTKA
ncbi:MAG TPA: glycosyltransferase family 2 protein [Candidatus Luteococcus avicola]|nr:glycosyltransferase family 2 protein [Candidatus Luteococcus avicola]